MSQNKRLGLFIVVTLAILSTFVFLIGSRQSMFQRHYDIRAEFDNVAGLNEGADVRVGGIRRGTVRRIELPKQPSGKVAITLEMARETQDVVKQDSVAAIRTEGLLGDKYVEVSFGSDEAERVKGGERIKSEPPLDVSKLISKTDQILDSTKGALDNIQETAGNLQNITAKINQGQGTFGALVNDKTIYKEAAAGVTSMREDMDALKSNFLLRGFFNKRGYVDSEELKKHEIARLPSAAPVKTFTFDSKQIFNKPDSAKLKNQKALKEAGEYLQEQQWGVVVISASTGMKGDSDKDLVLTQARATVIRNYLVQNYRLEDTRIKTMGLGKTEDNRDSGRVEILIYPG